MMHTKRPKPMENLWHKKTDNDDAPYVDLFESVRTASISNPPSTNQYRKDNERSTALRIEGNEKFRLENWDDAMYYYNRSLCFAENGSENVGLAFANRSACFFHMEMYDKVLVDIELATRAKVTDRLLAKLEQRKRDSEHLYNKMRSSRQSARTPKLSYAANKNFPCMADVIDIRTNKEFGRHMVAKCDIPAGKIVLIEENFMMVNSDDEPQCYTCFRTKANFIACQQCSAVLFCSVECSMSHSSTHRFECGTHFHSLHIEDKLQIKIVLLAVKLFKTVENLTKFIEEVLDEDPSKLPVSVFDAKSKYQFFLKLGKIPPTTFEILPETYKIYRNAMLVPKIADMFATTKNQQFLMHLMAHHFLVTNNNSYGSESNTTVCLVLSLVNHACSPNLHNYAHGNQRCCVTIRPVKKGQQLFTTYLSGGEKPLELRQKEIKQWWGFECGCDYCRAGNQCIDVKMALSNPTFRYVLQNYQNAESHSVVMEKCLKFLNKRANAPWSMEIQMMAAALGHAYQSMLA